jgi:hypothetical protein
MTAVRTTHRGRLTRGRPHTGGGGDRRGRDQLVLHLAGGADQQLEQRGGEIRRQLDLGAARQIAGAHLGDAIGLHHRNVVGALVVSDLPAHPEALAEQPSDLFVQPIQPPAEGVEAAHLSEPSRRELTIRRVAVG